jgi:Protein of unknown function (DUF732)
MSMAYSDEPQPPTGVWPVERPDTPWHGVIGAAGWLLMGGVMIAGIILAAAHQHQVVTVVASPPVVAAVDDVVTPPVPVPPPAMGPDAVHEALPPSADENYLRLLTLFHVPAPDDPARAVTVGHWVCGQMDDVAGYGHGIAPSRIAVANRLNGTSPFGTGPLSGGISEAVSIVDAAVDAYCPQYQGQEYQG